MGNLVIYRSYNQSNTIPANSRTTFAIPIAVDGYTPLGMTGIDHNNLGDKVFISKFSNTNTDAYITLANTGSNSLSLDLSIRVLYFKQ